MTKRKGGRLSIIFISIFRVTRAHERKFRHRTKNRKRGLGPKREKNEGVYKGKKKKGRRGGKKKTNWWSNLEKKKYIQVWNHGAEIPESARHLKVFLSFLWWQPKAPAKRDTKRRKRYFVEFLCVSPVATTNGTLCGPPSFFFFFPYFKKLYPLQFPPASLFHFP